MTAETYLNSELTSADKKAQYDEHARRLLKDKGVLAYVLKYAVAEFKDYTLDEAKAAIEGEPEVASHEVRPTGAITGIENESKIPDEGKMFFDILFTVRTKASERQKLYINLEAQKSFYPGYDLVTRGVIYTARLLSEQMDKEYTANNYDGAKKVYSIWICMNTPAVNQNGANVADTITEYSISPKSIYSSGEQNQQATGRYDLLSVVFVNLKDSTMKSSNKLIGMLSTLLSPKIQPDEKRVVLEEDYELPMTEEMKGDAAAMCNLSDAIVAEAVEEKNIELRKKDAELKQKDAENKLLANEIEQLKAKLAALQK